MRLAKPLWFEATIYGFFNFLYLKRVSPKSTKEEDQGRRGNEGERFMG
jgi:hypothetical protein